MFGKRAKSGDIRERPIDPAELRRSVDEGFLIAKFAVTIAVANHIIRNALQQHETFDPLAVAQTTRDELLRMAAEQTDGAERMREIRATAQKAKGRSKHQHDYRRGDDLKLRTREATYEELAAAMTRGVDDQAFIDGIVIAARERAWDDIGTTVVGRLGWAQRPAEDYEIGRDERVRQMLDEDFAALVVEHLGDEQQTPGDDDAQAEAATDQADPDAEHS
ncbi:hypothetical protein [Curtobacterium sp. Leaf261]|uniref:hypothetical protein n=1 Tax=Curtobacterium sp. Leaf261 TaxID=1736311 RepID=UPI0012E256C8|nr:hypothetical protein [Curtobacterium sp. Leaf261]